MSTPQDSPSIFQELDRFLGSFDVAAVAHGRSELSDDQKAVLIEMAAGGMSEEKRRSVMELLSSNTTALEFLADLLKRGGEKNQEGDAS